MAEPDDLHDFFVPRKPRTRYNYDPLLPNSKCVPSELDWVTYDDNDISDNSDADDYEPIEWSNKRKKEIAVRSEGYPKPSERSSSRRRRNESVVISEDDHDSTERRSKRKKESIVSSEDDPKPSERSSMRRRNESVVICEDDHDSTKREKKEKKEKKKKSDNENKKEPKRASAPRLGKEKVEGPKPPPELPQRVRDVIVEEFEGSGETLILQKRLHNSDLKK